MKSIQFKRFYSLARRYWCDCRSAQLDYYDKRACYRAAARQLDVDATLFGRLYATCFAPRPDPLDALNERVTGVLDALRQSGARAQ